MSIDFSPIVINEMKAKHPTMHWRVMDATALEYDEGAMASVIDKACLAIMTRSDSSSSL